MKKILIPMTGIVFILAILITSGCDQTTGNGNPDQLTEVDELTIFMKYEMWNEKEQLVLYDDYFHPNGIAATEHFAFIKPGAKVVWRRAADSGIRRIYKVSPKDKKYKIFPEDASTILLHLRYRVTARKDINVETPKDDNDFLEESYYIEYKLRGTGEKKETDPYLRIKGGR